MITASLRVYTSKIVVEGFILTGVLYEAFEEEVEQLQASVVGVLNVDPNEEGRYSCSRGSPALI